jgi:hypothetical protein
MLGGSRFGGRSGMLAAARRWSSMRERRRFKEITVTAIGQTWKASLVSNQRGPLVNRRAQTRADAYAAAHRLLEDAEDRTWFNGEVVSVAVAQSEQ